MHDSLTPHLQNSSGRDLSESSLWRWHTYYIDPNLNNSSIFQPDGMQETK